MKNMKIRMKMEITIRSNAQTNAVGALEHNSADKKDCRETEAI